MSTSDSTPELLVNEELVAYLDGELSPEDCRRVEERLAVDADYRQQLRDLDQAWEALDALPATNVDDHFARTTIEMVTVAAQRDIAERTQQVGAANRNRTVWWLAAGAALAVLGFAVTRMSLPNPNDELIANLPVIQQFDLLSQIDDVEFLRTLAKDVSLEKLAANPATFDRQLATWKTISESSFDGRRQWIESLSPEEKATLAERVKRFNDVKESPQEQQQLQQLRQLERTIRQDEDAELLQRTLLAYGSWLARRQPGEQEDLRVLSANERINLIHRLVREDEERALRHLSEGDAAKLRNEILEIYEERKSTFERAMRRRDPDNRVRLDGPLPHRALMVVLWELWNDDQDDKTTERLISQLSTEQQEYWKSLRRRGRGDRRREQLIRWIVEVMRPRPRGGPEELERFFTEKLTNKQRERLLTLPGEEMQAQLEQLYIADTLGLQGADEWLSEFGPGAGFPPGPPPGPGGPGARGGPRDGRRDRDWDRRDGGPPPRGEFGPGSPEMGPDGPRRPPPDERGERRPPPDDAPPPKPDGTPPEAR